MAKDKSGAAKSKNPETADPDRLLRVGDPAFQRLLDAAEAAEGGSGSRQRRAGGGDSTSAPLGSPR